MAIATFEKMQRFTGIWRRWRTPYSRRFSTAAWSAAPARRRAATCPGGCRTGYRHGCDLREGRVRCELVDAAVDGKAPHAWRRPAGNPSRRPCAPAQLLGSGG